MRVLPAVLLLLVLTGCTESDDGNDDAEPTTTGTPTSGFTPDEPPTGSPTETAEVDPPELGTRIVVHDSDYGPMLFDERNQAIYLFDVEKTEAPVCYDECSVAWPPVLSAGPPIAGRGVRRGLLGTTERDDGSLQVTYGGHPLYTYAHEGAGEVECHDVFLNGGNWYVVQPDGDRAP